jgi:pentapeptide MXKDX repeat protein
LNASETRATSDRALNKYHSSEKKKTYESVTGCSCRVIHHAPRRAELCGLATAGPASATGPMKKDDSLKKDTMSHDSMSKSGMSTDSKSKKMKKDSMKKDGMKHDTMKQHDMTKTDTSKGKSQE